MEIYINKLNLILTDIRERTALITTTEFKDICERIIPIIKKAFGNDTTHVEKINAVFNGVNNAIFGVMISDIKKLERHLVIIIDEIEMSNATALENKREKNIENKTISNKVFVVHGHNSEIKLSVARSIEKLGLDPIILHEQANAGNTLIEKFTKYSDVGFAVVILSADDFGYSKREDPKNAKLRARQNVIFELGFFTSHLGREKVVAIYENVSNFELPSDVQGVIYIPYTESDGKWQFDLSRELLHVGYNINTNNLVILNKG